MDIATLIGLVGGLSLVVITIVIGSPLSVFINIPGLVIVIGGTIAATLIMQKLAVVLGAIKVAMNTFIDKSDPPEKIIEQIVDFAAKARKGGMLALENEQIDNPYLARGVRMAVDGVESKEIVNALEIELDSLIKRHETGQKIFKFMGGTSPSMGMIGTLIGLVQMLQTMDDPSSIGPAMAVALLTTFYGAVMAFLIFIPIAAKLEDRTKHEEIVLDIVLCGIQGITKGVNKSILEDKLKSFLAPSIRSQEGDGE